jgi:hypothetical protein
MTRGAPGDREFWTRHPRRNLIQWAKPTAMKRLAFAFLVVWRSDEWFRFVGIQSTGHGPPIAISFVDSKTRSPAASATGRPSRKSFTTT